MQFKVSAFLSFSVCSVFTISRSLCALYSLISLLTYGHNYCYVYTLHTSGLNAYYINACLHFPPKGPASCPVHSCLEGTEPPKKSIEKQISYFPDVTFQTMRSRASIATRRGFTSTTSDCGGANQEVTTSWSCPPRTASTSSSRRMTTSATEGGLRLNS